MIDRLIFWLIEKEFELIVSILYWIFKSPVKSIVSLAAFGLCELLPLVRDLVEGFLAGSVGCRRQPTNSDQYA